MKPISTCNSYVLYQHGRLLLRDALLPSATLMLIDSRYAAAKGCCSAEGYAAAKGGFTGECCTSGEEWPNHTVGAHMRTYSTRFDTSIRSVLWFSNCYFLRLSWNFFLGFSHLLNNEMTNDLYVCDCVILSFCDRFVCLTLVVSSFLCLNIFQSARNLIQILVNAIPRDVFFFNFKFSQFLLTFLVLLDLPNFLR